MSMEPKRIFNKDIKIKKMTLTQMTFSKCSLVRDLEVDYIMMEEDIIEDPKLTEEGKGMKMELNPKIQACNYSYNLLLYSLYYLEAC